MTPDQDAINKAWGLAVWAEQNFADDDQLDLAEAARRAVAVESLAYDYTEQERGDE